MSVVLKRENTIVLHSDHGKAVCVCVCVCVRERERERERERDRERERERTVRHGADDRTVSGSYGYVSISALSLKMSKLQAYLWFHFYPRFLPALPQTADRKRIISLSLLSMYNSVAQLATTTRVEGCSSWKYNRLLWVCALCTSWLRRCCSRGSLDSPQRGQQAIIC